MDCGASEVPTKVCHFLWRVCTGSLAIMGILYAIHAAHTRFCMLCGEEWESIIHCVFKRQEMKQVWDCSPFGMPMSSALTESSLSLLNVVKYYQGRAA